MLVVVIGSCLGVVGGQRLARGASVLRNSYGTYLTCVGNLFTHCGNTIRDDLALYELVCTHGGIRCNHFAYTIQSCGAVRLTFFCFCIGVVGNFGATRNCTWVFDFRRYRGCHTSFLILPFPFLGGFFVR